MKGKPDNIGSCIERRSHLPLDPEPMYIRNDIGHKFYKQLGANFSSPRQKSACWVDDPSNKTGDRAKGGY